MRLSPKPPEIRTLDGFDNTDLFDYRQFGDRLAKLIGSLEDNPVLVIDGPWGSGKTTFARQWAGLLRKQGHAVAYFDAFAADHHKDPFLAFVEEVHCLATEADLDPNPEILCNFTKAAVAVGKELGLTTLDLALPGLGRLLGLAVEAGSQADPSLLEAWIQQAADRKKAIAYFRKCLEEVASTLAATPAESAPGTQTDSEQRSSPHRRMVFIVDELDRCRPLFALSLLERIKHVFGVQGLTFVLVANLEELGKCVQRVYGDVDEKRYLEKFFEIRVQLPGQDAAGVRGKIGRYVNHLFDQLQFPRDGYYDQIFVRELTLLAESMKLSLRTLEHAMRNARFLLQAGELSAAAFLSIARVTQPSLFTAIIQGTPDRFSKEEKAMFIDLWNRLSSDQDGDKVFSELGPRSELVSCARFLAQFHT